MLGEVLLWWHGRKAGERCSVSGPKVFSYDVQQRFDRAFRKLRRLQAQVDDIADRWQAMCREHEAFPRFASDLPDWVQALNRRKMPPREWERGTVELERRLAQLQSEFEDAQRRHAERIRAFQKETMQATLRAAVAAHRGAETATALRSAVEDEAQREEQEREYAEAASRAMEALAVDVSSKDRGELMRQAERTAAASPSRRRTLLMQLRVDIQRANTAAEARQRIVRQAEQWREDLAGLEGSDVAELDAVLLGVIDGEGALPQDMEQKVALAVARGAEKLKRDYVLDVVAEELQKLGYEVEPGFETASADAPLLVLRKPDMAENYHVALSADAATASLEAKVIREADTGTEERRDRDRERKDREAEFAWCGDVAAALAAAQNHGVRARVVSRHQPGDVAVETIAPSKSRPAPGRRRRDRMRRSRPREAQMSR